MNNVEIRNARAELESSLHLDKLDNREVEVPANARVVPDYNNVVSKEK